MAGTVLGAPQVRFVWQAQHLEILGASSYKSAEVRRRVMTLGATPFCVAGAALGAPHQARIPRQWQHLEHLKFLLLCGRRSTCTFKEVRGSPATSDDFGCHPVLRGRRSTWSTSSGSYSVAVAALGAPQVPFVVWQAQHLHLQRGPRKSGDK